MSYSDPEFWIQFGALGVLSGLMTYLYLSERKRANAAEARLITKAESWMRQHHEMTQGFSAATVAMESVVERVSTAMQTMERIVERVSRR